MQKLILNWLQAKSVFKTLAWCATLIVVYLSLKSPSDTIKEWNFLFRVDLVLHFACYFSLAVIYCLAFFTYKSSLKKAFIYAFFLGFILELLQLIPFFQRHSDIQDLFANLFGVSSGIFFIHLLFSILSKNNSF